MKFCKAHSSIIVLRNSRTLFEKGLSFIEFLCYYEWVLFLVIKLLLMSNQNLASRAHLRFLFGGWRSVKFLQLSTLKACDRTQIQFVSRKHNNMVQTLIIFIDPTSCILFKTWIKWRLKIVLKHPLMTFY